MKYIANPVEVDAFQIEIVVPQQMVGDKPTSFQLHMATGEVRTADAGMIARMTPSAGDYYVVQSDGYIYLNPKDVFERKYRPISGAPELNALELGAAVRRAGLAGS